MVAIAESRTPPIRLRRQRQTTARLKTSPPESRKSRNASGRFHPRTPENAYPRISGALSGHRFYSPVIGRWLNRDPIGENAFLQTVGSKRSFRDALGSRVYGFVHNNPPNTLDLFGLLEVSKNPVESDVCCNRAKAKVDGLIKKYADKLKKDGKDCITSVVCVKCNPPGISGIYDGSTRKLYLCVGASSYNAVIAHEMNHAANDCGKTHDCNSMMESEVKAYACEKYAALNPVSSGEAAGHIQHQLKSMKDKDGKALCDETWMKANATSAILMKKMAAVTKSDCEWWK